MFDQTQIALSVSLHGCINMNSCYVQPRLRMTMLKAGDPDIDIRSRQQLWIK
jgi:hypothetical protein